MAQKKKNTASPAAEASKDFEFSQLFGKGGNRLFSAAGKLIYRDLNTNTGNQFFSKYTKSQIQTFLENPQQNEHQLREAMQYLYNASSHLRRLIQYFASLTDWAYILSPYKLDATNSDPETLRKKYKKTADILDNADLHNQLSEIPIVCFREDVYYGTWRESVDGLTLQQLPSRYCRISSREEGTFNVSFDFSYFDLNPGLLAYYSPEVQRKYELYRSGKEQKWIELDAPNSFAIKCNQDTPGYAVPPFAGLLREIFEIEEYKQLKLTKTELENYAILVMTLGVDKEGRWQMDYSKAVEYWSNLDSVLPEQIGSVLSPMPIEKISFDQKGVTDSDKIAEAENNLWSAAGVSSMIFNSSITSSNALLTSIKADQALTYSVVKSVESMLNRYLHSKSFGKQFHVQFLDVSRFNRKEVSEAYLKGCQYGMPMVSLYCASLGLSQSDMMSMNFLEDSVLHITEKFRPLQSSATMSGASDTVGRPQKDAEDLSDAGEASRDSA